MARTDVVVVDNDVVSYIFSRRTEASRFLPILDGITVAVSFVTVGEMLRGALSANWGTRRVADLRRHLSDRYTMLPYDVRVADEWAGIVAACSRQRHVHGANDAWVAASAVAFDCTLVANDESFKRMAELYPSLVVAP